jgi:hypothetical protein
MHQLSRITKDDSVCLFPYLHLRTTWSSYALVKISYVSVALYCWDEVDRDPFGNRGWAHLAAGMRSCSKRVHHQASSYVVTCMTPHVSLIHALRARTAERHLKLCCYALYILGSGCIDPHFLDLGTNWRWVASFTPRPLSPPGKSSRYPLDRTLGGPQSRSGRWREEKIYYPTGTRTPINRSSSPQAVAIPTEISRPLIYFRFLDQTLVAPCDWQPCVRAHCGAGEVNKAYRILCV